jgi:galactose mutarotase-like enzyme
MGVIAMMYRKQRNYGCRIHDRYEWDGMRVVIMENEKVRVGILPDKGAEIFEFLYKPMDLDVMWLSPNGVQNPHRYPGTYADPSTNFVDYYTGGWQEVFPNGGPPSRMKGAYFGQHGEVSQAPWDYAILCDEPERIEVAFTVHTRKYPFRLRKVLRLDKNSGKLFIREEAENLSQAELPAMWGHHIVFGPPFLEPDCIIRLPGQPVIIPHDEPTSRTGRRVGGTAVSHWPYADGPNHEKIDFSRIPPPGTKSEMLYIGNLQEGAYTLTNPRIGAQVTVTWDHKTFPYLWYWQEYGDNMDYPWYGRTYNIGLEPFSSMPTNGLQTAADRGTTLLFRAQETKRFELTFEVGESKE